MQRRGFLQAGAGALAFWPGQGKAEVSCIVLMLTGGPSQLDTWDLKPEAPSEYRGPFRPIRTNVAGIEISEIFPRMARHADKYALVRSVWHEGPLLHDEGHRVMLTGRPSAGHPDIGSVMERSTGSGNSVLPLPVLHPAAEPEALRARYGFNQFGQSCLEARRLVERGRRFVTINMFETVFGENTWDIHGWSPFSPISCYRDHVGPMFDAAYSSLLEDLRERGLLKSTLVVAMGEFGRTPKINPDGGRDHWPRCSTIVLAGGGIRGGQVYGSSDHVGAEPKDNPVHASQVAATIYKALGVPAELEVEGPIGNFVSAVVPGARPIDALL